MKIIISQNDKIPVAENGVGLFLEDINYALDGGLYAEMLENRNFEAKNASGSRGEFRAADDGAYGWEAYPAGAPVAIKVKTDRALFPENPHYLRLVAEADGAGVKNKAYDGIYLTKGVVYKISFYARSYDYKGAAFAGVYAGGAPLFEKKFKLKPDGEWRKYSVRFKSKTDADGADFVFRLAKCGMVHLDCFSMMPENAVLGVFRRDLVAYLKELKPAFLRFPGGCVVEGNSLANRYQWKNSIGQTERRKHNWNRWAVYGADEKNGFQTPYSHYGQSLGAGYFEFFRLCEYLGCKPFPVVSLGLACQFMSDEAVPVHGEELETYIQDALDAVEFANGGADTVWGRVRAEMGHPQPFRLEYLGLGNEQWNTEDNDFYERFELFEKRIHEKYPELKIIGTAGPGVDCRTHRDAWAWTRKNLEKDPDFVYAVDEHFYVSPEWMYAHTDIYDKYPRTGRVCAGEFAAHIPNAGCGGFNAPQTNAWEGALAEAAFMTGMERNADVVVMSSYAPLFARLGYAQWSPDLIWFDGRRSYATASYYVQKLYSLYTGNYSLKTRLEGSGDKLYVSASERDGMTFVKIVNAGSETEEAEIEGDYEFGALARIVCMSAETGEYNTLEEPEKIVPREIAPVAPRSALIPPHSFCVLIFMK